jgi:hypothetical protein
MPRFTRGAGPPSRPGERFGRPITVESSGVSCSTGGYCLTKTLTLSTARPWASIPFVVVVRTLPSFETIRVAVWTIFPFRFLVIYTVAASRRFSATVS